MLTGSCEPTEQFLNTEPEEWDSPDVVEMLTRVRISEMKRPSSVSGRFQPIPEEADEKYRFGVSSIVDELLAERAGKTLADPSEARGRSLSVPLVDRQYWISSEVPGRLGGVDISLDSTARVKGLGAHLPPTMSRLSHIQVVTQAPYLARAGENGILLSGAVWVERCEVGGW